MWGLGAFSDETYCFFEYTKMFELRILMTLSVQEKIMLDACQWNILRASCWVRCTCPRHQVE